MNRFLCIPQISVNVTKEYLFRSLCKFNIGFIERIIEIPIKSKPNFKRIIVKIKANRKDQESISAWKRLEEGKDIKLVHEFPLYWKVVVAQDIKPSKNLEKEL
jgi:hypothetical protein